MQSWLVLSSLSLFNLSLSVTTAGQVAYLTIVERQFPYAFCRLERRVLYQKQGF